MSALAFARAAVDGVPGGGLDGVPGGGLAGVPGGGRDGAVDPRAGAGPTGVYGMKGLSGYAWAFAVPEGEPEYGPAWKWHWLNTRFSPRIDASQSRGQAP